MDRLVTILAPRGRADFLMKFVLWIFVIGTMNYGRDRFLTPYDGYGSFWHDFFEAAIVAIPFTFLALALVGHMSGLLIRLTHLAGTDVLTGLANRRAFMEHAGSAIGDGGVFMMIDVDRFKAINDQYGHGVGDIFLCALADQIRSEMRMGDYCGRLGGEEFGIFMPNATLADAVARGNRLAAGVTLIPPRMAVGVSVTNSVGAVEAGRKCDLSEVMRNADQALYRAKADGRARVVVWDGLDPLHVAGSAN